MTVSQSAVTVDDTPDKDILAWASSSVKSLIVRSASAVAALSVMLALASYCNTPATDELTEPEIGTLAARV